MNSAFADLDFNREKRCGFPEFIFGAGKTPEQIVDIMKQLHQAGKPVLATRLKPEAISVIRREIPEAEIHENAKTALMRDYVQKRPGTIAVVCAGTSDLPVAEEACDTLAICGITARLIPDVGVAGIHRLLTLKRSGKLTPSSPLPEWKGLSRASLPDSLQRPSLPFRPASATERRSAASPPCSRWSTAALPA